MKYASKISGIPIIDSLNDANRLGIGAKGLIDRDFSSEPYGSSGYAAPLNLPEIPRNEWLDRIEYNEKNGSDLKTLALNAGVQTMNQQQTNYCWAFGTVQCIQIVRALQGQPYVPLSPASVAGPITGYQNVGGWGTKALQYIINNGVSSQKFWPPTAISRQFDTAESREDRKLYKASEWYDVEPRNFAAIMTCLLNGIPVTLALDWWRHLVCGVRPVALEGGKFGIEIWNSWSNSWGTNGFGILTEQKSLPGESVAPRVVSGG